jgi:hypothetical protein
VIENAGTFFLLATQHIFVTFGSNKPDHHPKLRIRFIMRRNRIGLALCASVLTGAISPGLAQTPYDGLWTVTIVTNSGSCEPSASSTLTVTDGKISAAGADVTGSVGREGLVTFRRKIRLSRMEVIECMREKRHPAGDAGGVSCKFVRDLRCVSSLRTSR